MATHCSILGGRIPGQKNLEGYSLWGFKELDMTECLSRYFSLKKQQLSYVKRAKQGDLIESDILYIYQKEKA